MLSIVEVKDSDFLDEVRKRFIPTFLKINYEIPDLIRAMGIMVENTDIRLTGGKVNSLLEKFMKFANTKSTQYQIKIESAVALTMIGQKLMTVLESFIGNLHVSR